MAGEPLPLILDNAGLKINDVELACLLSHIEISPDISTTEITTMCGSIDFPGTIKWLLRATLYQSYDVDATYHVLNDAVAGGVAVPFKVIPRRSQPQDEQNPMFSGMVIPQPIAPIMGDAGEASTVELEWSIVGTYQANPPGTDTYDTTP